MRLAKFLILTCLLLGECTRSASSPPKAGAGSASLTASQATPGGFPTATGPAFLTPAAPGEGEGSRTPAPTRSSPSATATIPLPSGTPLPTWQGIPIMPGALAGQDDGYQYRYTIVEEILPVLNYYKTELPKLGWSFDKSGTGYQGEPLLTFKKGTKVLGVSVAVLSLEDQLLFVTVAFP